MKNTTIILLILASSIITAHAQVIHGNYAIKNAQTGMLLRVKDANNADGTPLVAYYPENWKCMTWDFKHIEGNTYQLQNLLTNKTFQAASTPVADAPLKELPFTAGKDVQEYVFEDAGNNTYRIKLKGTDLYVTPSDKKGSVNSQIILAAKTDEKFQQWLIYPQAPTM
jgi:hypothetical protein